MPEYVTTLLLKAGLSAVQASAVLQFGASLALNALAGALTRKSTADQSRELAGPNSTPVYRFAYGRARIQGTPIIQTVVDDVLYMCVLLNSRPSAGGVFRLICDARDVGLAGDVYDFGTVNTGAATVAAAASYTTVTHGLGSTPDAAGVRAWTSTGEYLKISHITSTTFRVTLGAAAPGGGTGFDWSAVLTTDGGAATNAPFKTYLNVWLGLGDQTHPPALILQEVGDLAGLNTTKIWRTDKMAGRTVLWIRAEEGPDASLADRWPSWPPSMQAELNWSKVWDMRDVAQDEDDPDTWEWSDNQALCLLDYLRENPVERYPLTQLRLDDFEDAADVADEPVALNNGGSQARYRVGGLVVFTPGAELNQLAAPIEDAGAGRLLRIDGKVGYQPGEYTAPTITLDETMQSAPIKFTGRGGSRDLPGAVQVSFPDPASSWELTPLIPYEVDPNWDGSESRITALTLPLVPDAYQAMRIQQIRARQAALTKSLSATFPPTAVEAVAGSIVTVDFPISGDSRNGIYRVESSAPAQWLEDGDQVSFALPLTMRQTAASVYTWVPATDEQDIYEVSEAPPDPGIPEPTSIEGTVDGTDIDLAFEAPEVDPFSDAPQAEDLFWQFRRNQDAFWQTGGTEPNVAGAAAAVLTPVATGESYDFRVRSLYEDRFSDWLYDRAVQVGFTLAAPTGFTATGGVGQIALSVTAPGGASFHAMQFWGADVDDPERAVLLSEQTGSAGAVYTHTQTGLLAGQTRYYFARAVTSDAAVGAWVSDDATAT